MDGVPHYILFIIVQVCSFFRMKQMVSRCYLQALQPLDCGFIKYSKIRAATFGSAGWAVIYYVVWVWRRSMLSLIVMQQPSILNYRALLEYNISGLTDSGATLLPRDGGPIPGVVKLLSSCNLLIYLLRYLEKETAKWPFQSSCKIDSKLKGHYITVFPCPFLAKLHPYLAYVQARTEV